MHLFENIINKASQSLKDVGGSIYDSINSTGNYNPQTIQKKQDIIKQDPTQSPVYKAISKFDPQAKMFTESLQDTSKMYEQKAQEVSQWGKNVASNPGLIALGKAWKEKYPDTESFDDATIGKSVLEKYPEYQQYVDSKTTALGYGAKAIGGIGSMAVSAPGMVTGGAEQLGRGLGTIASAQSGQDVVEGGLQALKGATTAGFGVATGAMPIASTVFGGATGFEPVQQGLGYLVGKAGDISAGTAGILGGNQQVQEQARGLGEIALPAVALGGLSKSGKIIKPVAKVTGKAIVKGAEVVAPTILKGAKTIVTKTPQAIGKGTATLAEGGLSQVSGLERSSIQNIVKSPELFKKARTGEITRETELANASTAIEKRLSDLSEMGKGYEAVRKAQVTIPKNEISGLVSKTLDELGFEKSPTGQHNLIDLPNQDRTAIQSALKYLDEYTGDLSAKNALSLRQKLDSLVDWKSDATPAGERVVKAIRSKLDEYIGERIPGLKQIDAQYGPEKEFLRGVRKGLYNKDGSLKDNALSTIGNITGKGKENMLARLEEITPGIGKRIEALKAFEDVQRSSGIKVGAYTRSAGSVALGVVNPFVALATWIATHPVVVSRVLESAGLATQKIKDILSKGKNISQSEAKVVQEAVAKVPQTEVEKIITNLSFDPKANKLTSKTIVGPTNSNTKRPKK